MTNLDKIREIMCGDNFSAIHCLLTSFDTVFCYQCCESRGHCKTRCSNKLYNWLKKEYNDSEKIWRIITREI